MSPEPAGSGSAGASLCGAPRLAHTPATVPMPMPTPPTKRATMAPGWAPTVPARRASQSDAAVETPGGLAVRRVNRGQRPAAPGVSGNPAREMAPTKNVSTLSGRRRKSPRQCSRSSFWPAALNSMLHPDPISSRLKPRQKPFSRRYGPLLHRDGHFAGAVGPAPASRQRRGQEEQSSPSEAHPHRAFARPLLEIRSAHQ